jgi:hypothetical protein
MTNMKRPRALRATLLLGCALAPALACADGLRLVAESADDGFGFSVAPAGDVNGDAIPDVVVGAPSQDALEDFAGRAYVFYGPFDGDRDAADADATISTQNFGDNVGFSVASAGDTNDDGFDDLLVGARGNDARGIQAGQAYLFLGPLEGALFPADADATFAGDAFDELGRTVASAGDLNGDGFADVAIGSPLALDGGVSAGQVLVYYGPVTGAQTPQTADATINGLVFNELLGHSVAAAGDLDGDGIGDLAIGAPRPNLNGSGTGTVYVFFGPVLGTMSANEADVRIVGERLNDEFGSAVSSAGDVNADGIDDLFVGASQFSGGVSGRAYVFHGPLSPLVSAADADAILVGEANGDIFGSTVDAVGDVNGDGFGDFVVGGEFSDTISPHAGRALLYFGPLAGTVPADRARTVFTGEGGDALGISVAGAGDLDGDGLADLLLGASGTSGVGYAQVLFGADLSDRCLRVSVTATGGGPIVIPPGGGELEYDLVVRNLTDLPQEVDVWTNLVTPPARAMLPSPVLGPGRLTLPPGGILRRTLTQSVPGALPNGNFSLNANARSATDTIGDLAALRFTKGASSD